MVSCPTSTKNLRRYLTNMYQQLIHDSLILLSGNCKAIISSSRFFLNWYISKIFLPIVKSKFNTFSFENLSQRWRTTKENCNFSFILNLKFLEDFIPIWSSSLNIQTSVNSLKKGKNSFLAQYLQSNYLVIYLYKTTLPSEPGPSVLNLMPFLPWKSCRGPWKH